LRWASALRFFAAFLLNAAFIIVHAHHEHDHNGPGGTCATCAQVVVAGTLLRQLFVAVVGAAIVAAVRFTADFRENPAVSRTGFLSPVCLKVRLNN
jgi:hypothetical protein